jgi:uncharacterized membrane protein YczE
MNAFLTTTNVPVRLLRLLLGLFAYGMAIALMIKAHLGASPWDVFSQGLSRTTHLSFGLCTLAISAVVLLLWFPLRQRPGFGTLANAVSVGFFADFGLAVLPDGQGIISQILLFVAGLLLLAFASALYIGAGMGPGPRDGLMTGLLRVTGRPVWVIRTGLELTVVLVGFLLGGTVGIGTAVFAAGIGPLIQLTSRWLRVDLAAGHAPGRKRQPVGPDLVSCAPQQAAPAPE